MTTETDICNLALDLLKEAAITGLDQDRPIAKWLSRNFATTRDSVLSRAEWNCAIKRASLPADATAPAFGWDYQYTTPSDCLRVLPLTYDGMATGRPLASDVEGGRILTNESGPLKVRYIYRNETYGQYPAVLIEAIAAALAAKMAHWVTGKTGYVQIAKAAFNEAISTAWLVDAIEGDQPTAADNEWIDYR